MYNRRVTLCPIPYEISVIRLNVTQGHGCEWHATARPISCTLKTYHTRRDNVWMDKMSFEIE